MKKQQMSVASSNGSSGVDTASEVLLDDGDNAFSFYELWNHEIHVLKTAIDEKLLKITERSQREIDRLTATVTGMKAKSHRSIERYKIKELGPKIPPSQWSAHRAAIKQQHLEQQLLQKQQQEQKEGKSYTIPIKTIETLCPGRSDSKSIKSAGRDLRLSPSCRSHTTATSDKTIPQSNLSSLKKYPTHIVTNVLSIPEEASLQPTTDDEENEIVFHDIPNIMSDKNKDDEHVNVHDASLTVKSSSSSSSNRDVFVDAVSHLSENEGEEDDKDSARVVNVAEPLFTLDRDAFYDIPSMVASMSISSGSQQSDRSDTKSPLLVSTELAMNEIKPKQKYRKFDSSKERRSPNKNDERSLFPWLKEKLQPFQRRLDAPSFTIERQKKRPDAPASQKEVKKDISSCKSDWYDVDDHDLMVVFENDPESRTVANKHETCAAKVQTVEIIDVVNYDGNAKKTSIVAIEPDEQASLVQPIAEACVMSFPSIEETVPSLTDREITAICQAPPDDKTVDNQSIDGVCSSSQRKHRKPPPSPETFMMAHSVKKVKIKKSLTASMADDRAKVESLSNVLNGSDQGIRHTHKAAYNSIQTSTCDTTSKIEDFSIEAVDSLTPAPISSSYNKTRLQPVGDDCDPSLIRLEHVTDRKIIDPYNDEGLYTGILIRGKPESHGTMKYKDGRFYTGSWNRGRWNGHGKAIFANGDTYTGDYVNDQRHGVGRYEWSDARVYDGRFENDQREGQGTYSWPNGSVYCGEFHLGLRHGKGTYTYEDGSVYSGEWQNGKQNGTGECVWADGRCFRGEWQKGHPSFGVEIRADGSIRHDGKWHNNRPVRTKDSSKKNATHPKSRAKLIESERTTCPSLEYLRQGKSLVRSISYSSSYLENKPRIKTTSTSMSG